MLKFLTEREREVLRGIIDGLSTEQMAERLGVQRSTVRRHVQNVLTKLGVHSRLEAAAVMTAHASKETWADLGIAGVTAGADDERVADAARLVRGWVAKQAAIEALLEALLEAVREAAQLSEALLTPEVVSLSERRTSATPGAEAIALLTARELDVLRGLIQGLSGNQIAALLRVSPNTVRTHRRSILRKLNVHSSLEAAALARRAGVEGLRANEMNDPGEGSPAVMPSQDRASGVS